ncbi:MAG: hypothetical protein ACYCSX_02490 [Acidimicrobiales bacterium]
MHIGTTTVENLLRVARRDTAAGTAFAALDAAGRASEIISVPEPGSAEGLSADELAELVRQASADPEFVHARVFVRSGRVGRQVTLAVAPLRGGGGHGMIGLVAEPDRRFEAAHLDVLGQLAERLVRHLRVVQQLARGGDPGADRAGPDPGADRAGPGPGADRAGPDPGSDRAGPDPGADGGDERPDRLRSAGPWEPEAPRWVPEAPEFPLSVGAGVPADVPVPASPGSSLAPSALGGARASSVRAPKEGSADAPVPERTGAATSLAGPAPKAEWWAERDQLTGLPGLASFFSRAGRLLAPGARSAGTFVLVVVEVPDVRTAQAAARVLAATLRSTDPVGRVEERLFAAALLLADEGSDMVERRLAVAVGSALDHPAGVRTAHVAAAPGDGRDVDELLRDALARLQDR